MGRKKTAPGTPCVNGHSYERRGPHGCRECHLDRKRALKEAMGAAWYKKRYNPGWRQREHWIVRVHRHLARRSRGQPRAKVGELRALWERQCGRCALTRLPLEGMQPHLDHIVPVAAGGAHTIENLQWVHPMANHAKNGNSVAEFRAWVLAAADTLRDKMKLESLL